MKMRHFILFASLAFLVAPQVVEAGAIISVDMDPLTPGIQSSATITVGSIFTIDVLVSDDGQLPTPTIFDALVLEVSYNDSGTVLAAGPMGYVGGTLAGNNPGVTVDLFGMPPPVFSATGAPLSAGASNPAAGFDSGGGVVGLFDLTLFTVDPGPPVSAFSFDFTALAVGNSTILAAGSPPGSPALSLGIDPIEAQLVSGSVNVVPNPNAIPEPQSLTLLGIGAACLAAFAVRQRRRKTSSSNC